MFGGRTRFGPIGPSLLSHRQANPVKSDLVHIRGAPGVLQNYGKLGIPFLLVRTAHEFGVLGDNFVLFLVDLR